MYIVKNKICVLSKDWVICVEVQLFYMLLYYFLQQFELVQRNKNTAFEGN